MYINAKLLDSMQKTADLAQQNQQSVKSLNTFIGARDFNVSRGFYTDIGFIEVVIFDNLSYFKMGDFGFYLQEYAVKEWLENTVLCLEIIDIESYFSFIQNQTVANQYPDANISDIQNLEWGKVFNIEDPSGVLWHVAEFKP